MSKHWKTLADELESFQGRVGLRWAIEDWKAEGERIKALAPFDFMEAIEELTGEKKPNLPKVHRQSA